MSFLWGNTANQQPKQRKFANISVDQINSNQQSVPVKYLAGRNYVAGDYITPAYNPKAVAIKSKTGKSESSTTGYKYYADFALMFCTGGRRPVDAIYKVIVDSDIRWSSSSGVNRLQSGNPDREVIQVPNLGTLCIYWGSETQAIDNVLLAPRGIATGMINPQDSTTWPENTGKTGDTTFNNFVAGDVNPYSGHYDHHPAYRGQCYGVFKNWKLGRDRTSVQNIQLELKRGCPWFNNGFVAADDLGVNPIAILYDWFTDTRFGMALPESYLNYANWLATYNAAEALGMRLSPLITGQSDFRQVIAEMLEYLDGWIRRNGTMIEVGLWKHGTSITKAATLTDDDLLGEPELEPQGWGPTMNEITVSYKDRAHNFNDYVQVYRDPNNFRITGGPRPTTLQRPWITDANLAKAYAQQTGAIMALPFTSGSLKVKREWLTNNALLPGMVIEYDSGFYGLSFLLRLQEVEHSADNSASAALTVEWERSKWPSLYTPPGFQGPGGFVIGPRAVWKSKIIEVPYLLADQKFDTQILPLAVRANNEVEGFRVWISFDGGGTYVLVPNDASTSSFASFGRTFGAIGPTDGGVGFYLYGVDLDRVVSQTPAQWSDDNLMLILDSELISIGRIISYGHGFYTAYIKRGRYGTTPVAHAASTDGYFMFRDQLMLLDNAGFTPGATILVKLQPFAQDLDYDLSTVTPISYPVIGLSDIASPVLSPSPGTFATTIDVRVSQPAGGYLARFTTNGTPVRSSSQEWPRQVGGVYNFMRLSNTTTLRVRFINPNGRYSAETVGVYTRTGAGALSVCGAPTWSFNGTLFHTGGQVTLTATTQGSVIYYRKNGGTATAYTTPVSIACTASGDTLEFWATLVGMSDSPHVFVDNSLQTTYGGGRHTPPIIT